jgi:ligand-binding sensor domain-containing protein/two-component sensor histidine kinase
MRATGSYLLSGLLLLAVSRLAPAERLPIKTYTTADGLPHNTINKIVRDSRGFLWFCTADGLSRFDGYSFKNYGTDQGLPHREVNDLLETREGEYWVATTGGLVRFNPKEPPESQVIYANRVDSSPRVMFTVITPQAEHQVVKAVTSLLEDHSGTIWCGTWKGLYRLELTGGYLALRPVSTGMPDLLHGEEQAVSDLLEDRHGSLWIAARSGLYRRWPDGSAARYTKRDGLPDDFLHDLLQDRENRLWAGTRYGGFFQFDADNTHSAPVVVRAFSTREGMPTPWVFQLFEGSDHKFWIATARGLLEFYPERDKQGRSFRSYSERNGLTYFDITALNEDLGGNVWLGTNNSGVMRVERNGFVTYDERDGIYSVNSIFGDRAGGVCFRGAVLGDKRTSVFEGAKLDALGRTPDYHYLRLGRFDGRRFTWFKPDAVADLSWVNEGNTLQTRSGEWWVGTARGLYRFPTADNFDQIKTARPIAVYASKDGLGDNPPWRLFEDSHRNVWISTMSARPLMMWEGDSQTLRNLSTAPGFPTLDTQPRSFGEDLAGDVWVGLRDRITRYHNGRFTTFAAADGVPPGAITSIYVDHAGRLWFTSARSGLVRVDQPEAQHPRFVHYTTAEGLSSNSTEPMASNLLVEDLQGHIYVGTGLGLDRLDPVTGHFRHFTTADGLARGLLLGCFRDRDGGLWFGMTGGVSHFVPAAESPSDVPPPPVLFTDLHVAGSRRFVSALGEDEMTLGELAKDRSQLQIDFIGLSFVPGDLLHYQHKLEGADEDWSTPTDQRSINFARLAPGRYRLLVRAVDSDAVVSARPAVITFRILPPFWARWWFLSLVGVMLTLILYALHRYRVARLLELERVRTRIASDLHDDIGANLSLIAGLSDMLRQHARSSDTQMSEKLSLIADVSRRSLDAMSDIVWAVNPNRDHLSDLTQRMRRFATETLGSRGIEFRFESPSFEQNTKIGADVRREVFLIFKEGVNNIARHSHCTLADISLDSDGGLMLLKMSDNGTGFDVDCADWGQGLDSIRKRAEKVGAELNLISTPGHGAMLLVRAPLK